MELTPEWIGVILSALELGGGFGVWIEKRWQANRSAVPIVRAEWRSGSGGHSVRITLVNRLDEDLRIERAEAKTNFVENEIEKDAGGSIIKSYLVSTGTQVSPDWAVLAGRSSIKSFRLEGADSAAWIRLTVSSSARTLCSKRIVVERSQKP